MVLPSHHLHSCPDLGPSHDLVFGPGPELDLGSGPGPELGSGSSLGPGPDLGPGLGPSPGPDFCSGSGPVLALILTLVRVSALTLTLVLDRCCRVKAVVNDLQVKAPEGNTSVPDCEDAPKSKKAKIGPH